MTNSAYRSPMAEPNSYPPGSRRVARPAAAVPCSNCGELVGRGYPDCVICAERIDELWSADWQALLDEKHVNPGTPAERELATLVSTDPAARYSWTCTDWALWLLRCPECGGQLASGERGCVICAAADNHRWAYDHEAMPHAMTGNEHALRVAVAGLRAPHRHRATILAGWRLLLPFLFVGDLPTTQQAQRIRALVLAGRYAELARQPNFAAMAYLPDLPWRRHSTR
jgi:hypothetical protein